MPRCALKCTVDLKLQAITCPGVWLPNKDDVYVSVCILGQHRRTPLVSSVFPLLFYTEMDFSKVFWTAVDPSDVVDRLEREHIYVELVQLDYPSSGTVLAKYENNLRDFLFPYPAIAPKILKDRDVLMEKTIDFPNGITPRLEFSCTTNILETPTPYTDAYESATSGLDDIRIRVPVSRFRRALSPPPRHSCNSDHFGLTHRPTHDYSEEFGDDDHRRPFVVRRIDNSLISRVPGAAAPEPFTSSLTDYKPRSTSATRARSRSRSRTPALTSLRARSLSPTPRTTTTRGLYGVYDRTATPERRSYLDDEDTDDVVARYRPSTPSYYERLKKQIEDDSLNRRIEQRVQEALLKNRYYYYPYYWPYSWRWRYPYTSEALDRLALDLERARIRRYYP